MENLTPPPAPESAPPPAPEPAPESAPPPAPEPAPEPAPPPAPESALTVTLEPDPREVEISLLREQLRAAQRAAADALRQLAIATEQDIVPDLIQGETPDEVRESIERSRAAYRAALAHIARSLPTPPQPAAPPQSADPITLISKGLKEN